MPSLAELQAAFRRALLQDDAAAIAALVAGDGLAAAERVGVHRNNLFASLTAVLRDTFPAVCRLVDERFFAYAAHEFIAAEPPSRAVLAEYGADFPAFLRDFPPCRGFSFLADVARLEWLMARAARAAEAEPLAAAALAAIAPEDTPRLALWLHPALGFLASPFPVDRLWRANRPGGDAAPVDVDAGGVRLEIARSGGDVVMRPLDPGSFALRAALAGGAALEAAAAQALAAMPGFDLARALGALFRDGAVIAVELLAASEAAP
jgi:hypothetical protein